MNKEVTVCLLTYNRAGRLPETIESLLAQTFGDFDLIISDDCSTDATESVCREYAQKHGRIYYQRNEDNLGMPGNLNATLQRAAGQYIMNLHDGDIYRQDMVEKCYLALKTNPSAGFVFNAYRSTGANEQEIIFREAYPPLIPGRELGARLLSRWDSCVFGTVMARRDVYEHLGWFNPEFGNFSDVDMWLRIAREFDVAYINEPLMTLMPRDPTRFYAFVHWRVLFWILGIHTLNLFRYRDVVPDLVQDLSNRYPLRRRKHLLYNMLICVKYRRWDRVQEGLAIWRDADDIWLRLLGRTLGRKRNAPGWYNAEHFWTMAQLKTSLHNGALSQIRI